MASYEVFVLYSLLFSFMPIVIALRSITQDKSIHYNETLVSAAGTFEAGFVSLENSQHLYFSIWYKTISPRTIVWVANRDTPLGNSTGFFGVTDGGNPVILDGTGTTIWSSNASTTAEKPVLLLLDTGNLVVKDGNSPGNHVWQSFDYPGDTLLPGMILRSNRVRDQYKSLTSWKDEGDPAPGDFSYRIDAHGYPQLVITKGSRFSSRVGPWNGFFFSGVPWETLNRYFNFTYVLTEQEVQLEFEPLNRSIVSRYMITSKGFVQRFMWSEQTESWQLFLAGPRDQCDNYAFCGADSNCDVNNSPQCECLRGFIPKSLEKWNALDWTDGCVRKVNLDCDNRDGFLKYTQIRLPDTSFSWYDKNMNLEECEKLCLKNCSCTAYSNLDVRDGGSGCLIWFNNIMDMKTVNFHGGQELYIRVAASELVNGHGSKKKRIVGITVGVVILALTTCVCIVIIKRRGVARKLYRKRHQHKLRKEEYDLPTFDLSIIARATENFSTSNKLGEGGFGSVYKGTLTDGQEIAVKRLSKRSGQGLEEFKNEVVLIAKLQHRNLVKLLGYCVRGEEKMLIYEYMSNKSLDYFIFDETGRRQLDWLKRFNIIRGIARGLLYLHQDSRLRIIHRDLKTSNILLDADLDPKISDFGLARIFLGDQDKANTNKVAGTYGYMPPEYAVHGHFSMKSDIFSYGVIVLEIISGKKNREFSDPERHLNLLGHAWNLWTAERPLELLDEVLRESCTPAEVIRCIQVGLLCVQQRPEDRPDMSSVVLMLNGEKSLAKPKVPGFYTEKDIKSDADSSSSNRKLFSPNEVSITMLDAR